MHIVILDAQTITKGDLSFDGLRTLGDVTVYPLTAYEEIADRVADADAVLCNKTLLNGYTLRKAAHLCYIGLFATGYNNIDIAYAREHGITVCNAGSYSTEAVAQHTFGLILEHYSRVGAYNGFVQQGNWQNSPTFSPFVFDTEELYGKTIALVGYGHIGRAVARIAHAFGMRVLACTRTPQTDENTTFLPLEEMLPLADIVSVHCPLTPQTECLLNANTLRLCKHGAFLVNTARGAVVDEVALRHALESGQLGGAGIDVLETEPMPTHCPLLGAPNCLITPHVAWAPIATRRRLLRIVEENLRHFQDGTPMNVVSN